MNRSDRNRIVEDNLALVGFFVNLVHAKATHVERDDLASAGSMGLISAAEAFDPGRGVPFSSFARTYILGAMYDSMRSADWASRRLRRRMKSAAEVTEKLTASLGRNPTVDEIAMALGVDRATAVETIEAFQMAPVSLSDGLGDGIQPRDSDLSPEDVLLVDELTMVVREAVAALPEKMRYVVEQVYLEERTVGEVAAELGRTDGAVSHLRREAMLLLREGIEKHYADSDEASTTVVNNVTSIGRREGFLSSLGERVAGGITRAVPAGAVPVARAS